jgi:hypothetical protein
VPRENGGGVLQAVLSAGRACVDVVSRGVTGAGGRGDHELVAGGDVEGALRGGEALAVAVEQGDFHVVGRGGVGAAGGGAERGGGGSGKRGLPLVVEVLADHGQACRVGGAIVNSSCVLFLFFGGDRLKGTRSV